MLTLNHAVSCLSAGDTLLVRGGTYAESLLNNIPSGTSWSNMVRIRAYPDEIVWLAPSSGPRLLEFGSSDVQQYIEVDRINFDGAHAEFDVIKFYGLDSGRNAHHIRIQDGEVLAPLSITAQIILSATYSPTLGTNLEFKNLVVHRGNAGSSDFAPHGFYMNGADALIEGCDIYDVGANGIQVYNQNGGSPDRAVIRNNKIHDITVVQPGGRHRGIVFAAGTGHKAYNNLIYNISGASELTSGIELVYVSAVSLFNNTIYNTQRGIRLDNGITNTVLRNNITYGNSIADLYDAGSIGTDPSNNLFGTNPLFVNPGAGNFHLQPGSPAIDEGAAVSEVTKDIAGTPRPQGSGYDIGAYESGGSAPPPPPPPPPPSSVSLTLTYLGKTRDVVGPSDTAASADGTPDAVFNVSASASKTLTALTFTSTNPAGQWNTLFGDGNWFLGVAGSASGSLVNASSLNYPVSAGGSFSLFASPATWEDHFVTGNVLTLNATFSDGTTGFGSITMPATVVSPCDVNQDDSPNVSDVQLAINQVLGTLACVPFGQTGSADINRDGQCTVVDVQRVVNAALGGQCATNP